LWLRRSCPPHYRFGMFRAILAASRDAVSGGFAAVAFAARSR
jgi:hypothetical protein